MLLKFTKKLYMDKVDKKYTGVIVPMVTPITGKLQVDIESAEKIAHKLISVGVVPFVLGSTGEGPSMSLKQKLEMVGAVANICNGRSELYAGLSVNSFQLALEEASLFADIGATVLVVTLPYYFPVDESQMLRFFTELADRSPIPLFLYNMPGMVKISIPLAIAEQLSHHPNIVGMKDSERDESRLNQSISLWKDREDFSFVVGWAARSLQGLMLGADGIVPSTGNISPEWYINLYEAALKGKREEAADFQEKTDRLSLLYQENRDLSHSIPALKVMMSALQLCSPEVLPPMYRMEPQIEKYYYDEVVWKLNSMEIK
jgi:dihydrodipicolinate synthase/N-acetylneuraminate lyase